MTNDNDKGIEPEDKADMKDGAQTSDSSPHFDMYHFFSRKDVILAAIIIIAILLYLVTMHLMSPDAV